MVKYVDFILLPILKQIERNWIVITLNGATSVAYGDQTRLILTEGANDLLKDNERKRIYVESRQMFMNEYDLPNSELDGVIVYDCDISYKECILLKFYELRIGKLIVSE